MAGSVKAALLSGLVFPGVGHIALKQYRRGFILMTVALVALSVIVSVAIRQALAIVSRIENGEIPAGTEAVADMVARSASAPGSTAANIFTIVLAACWLIGIIDSYRLGAEKDRRSG